MRATWILVICALAAGSIPAPATAGQTQTLQQQVRAMQQQLRVLVKQNVEQRRRIDRLEHGIARASAHKRATAVASGVSSAPASAPVAQFANYTSFQANGYARPPIKYAGNTVSVGVNNTTPPSPDNSSPHGNTLGQPGPQQETTNAVYQQQNALFARGLTFTPEVSYSYGDSRFFTLNGFMALGAIFLGNINVSRQQNSIATTSFNLTYGATKRLQYDVTVPFVSRSSTFSSVGAETSSAKASEKTIHSVGLGDINAGFYYQLPQRTLSSPAVILNGHVSFPTGRAPYGIKIVQDKDNNNLSYTQSLPTGGGTLGFSTGATIIKQMDPAILFGGMNLYYNTPTRFGDINPIDGSKAVPGWVAPGSAVSVTMGTAFALNDHVSTSLSFQDTVVNASRTKGDKGSWSTIPGSTVNAGMFNIGLTYAVNKHLSWQTLLGIGVTKDAPNFTLSLRVPHSF